MIKYFDIFAGIGGFRSGLEKAGPWGNRKDLPNPSSSKRAGSAGRTNLPLPRHAGYPAQKQYRFMRRGSRDWQDLRLPDRLHFTEKVCPAWTCRFSAGGDFYLQRCLTGLYHRRIHSVFIPDFSGESCYFQTHPSHRAKRKRAFCLRRPTISKVGSGQR